MNQNNLPKIALNAWGNDGASGGAHRLACSIRAEKSFYSPTPPGMWVQPAVS